MKRVISLLLIILVPALAMALQLRPEAQETSLGFVQGSDPIVLSFDRDVKNIDLTGIIEIRLSSGEIVPSTIQVAGPSIVIRPEEAWPLKQALSIVIDRDIPMLGRGYSGPSSITFYVQGDEWDRLEQSSNPQKKPTRETKADGYLENGVEVYPLPFTPNGDGYNDELHIARPGIGFRDPYIRFFSPDGVRVMS
ncbi:MAG TPA: hypothetical protein ENH10_06390, partial [Bacteroidetes bacterium]|nr:hypothetical protein [Bacteroidota bacterium]HEX04771.1 hypothetical protein [Bacteroidota bacterium]